MHRRRRSPLLATLLGCVALLLSVAPCAAQYREGRDATIPTMELTFGVAGRPTPGRWMPITASLTGGTEPFGGTLKITYQQDPTQAAISYRAVAVTPDKTVEATIVVKPPPDCDRILVELFNDSGRPEIQRAYTMFPQRRGELQLPSEFSDDSPVVLLINQDRGPSRAARGLATVATNRPIAVVRTDPTKLFADSMAYDGCLAIVAGREAFERADAAHVRAIRTWTNAGGRLLLFVNGPGRAWRSWLPPGEFGDFVSAAPITDVPIPEGLQRESEGPSQPDSIAARPLSISSMARQHGWILSHQLADGAGLVAEGPVGLGWVTVVGFDPRALTDPHNRPWTDRIVDRLTRELIADFDDVEAEYVWGVPTPVYSDAIASDDLSRARTATLERLGSIGGAGRGVFLVIVLSMLLLAVAVGPFDAIVLKRCRMRHRSWLTALCWIGLATLGAVYLPGIIRTEKNVARRFTVVDTLQPTPDGHGALSFESSLSALFSASSRRGAIGTDRPGWWSGVALVNERTGSGAELQIVQRPPRVRGLSEEADPWGGFGTDADGSALIESTALKLWTLRMFEDRSRVAPTVLARVEPSADGHRVTLAGLPAGVVVTDTSIRIGPDPLARVLTRDPSKPNWFNSSTSLAETWDAPPEHTDAWNAPDFTPAHSFQLRGPDRRTMSADARLATLGWAEVRFRYTIDRAPDLGLNNADGSHEFVHRLIVPIAPATDDTTPTTTTSGPDA